ncbi:hypothetical protein [Amycolatopsis sp. DG1A-15b]|uniref:hypothetical protein n=1 Tax=Amycolatopsis sp. DG1A-15b TaxID=3052846 RepID=UPI00255B905C|nr:hypothetical protein [Amycolatopsis sp. DG1A-15b]WIX92487.1 hypothetical protein QRY02_19425 [Amycolatopsis sp. DG1A-15b]
MSRERIARYASLRERVDRPAGHLNGSYGRMGGPVLRYTNSVLDFDGVVSLYRAAESCTSQAASTTEGSSY